MNPHQRCFNRSQSQKFERAKTAYIKRVKTRLLEIIVIWTFDSRFSTIVNKTWTYITFKSAVKKNREQRVTATFGNKLAQQGTT